MSRFYERLRAVIEAHRGTVQQFSGDGLVAAFGVQELREDDAVRAVQARRRCRRSLADLNHELDRRWGVRLRMRTGVNTGELVISEERDLRRRHDEHRGAPRAGGSAGQVLVGEATWRLVHHAVELESVARSS